MLLPQTAADYEIKYNEKRGKEYSKFHGYAYDGMWTIAFALKYVKAKLLARNFIHSPSNPFDSHIYYTLLCIMLIVVIFL